MGTRHLTAVFQDGEYKVAQYGQWDGYLEGQGVSILSFLKKGFDKESFAKNLANSEVLTDEQLQDAWTECGADPNSNLVNMEVSARFKEKYPSLSRDTGSDILEYIQEKPVPLSLDLEFAGDSLFCEWAYVIDLDKNTFEVFQGFNEEPLEETERFAFLKSQESLSGSEYYPVKHLHTFDLNSLPSVDEFLAIEPVEDEEDGEDAA